MVDIVVSRYIIDIIKVMIQTYLKKKNVTNIIIIMRKFKSNCCSSLKVMNSTKVIPFRFNFYS